MRRAVVVMVTAVVVLLTQMRKGVVDAKETTTAEDVEETVVRATLELEGLNWSPAKEKKEVTFEIEIHPSWAPVAADRFIELCKSEFYDVRHVSAYSQSVHGARD